jgi:hypothetical protein
MAKRVMCPTMVRVVRGRPQRALMHRQLAQNDRAGVSQTASDGGVLTGNAQRPTAKTIGRGDARNVDIILQSDGDPIQRSQPLPPRSASIRGARLRQSGIRTQRDETVQ